MTDVFVFIMVCALVFCAGVSCGLSIAKVLYKRMFNREDDIMLKSDDIYMAYRKSRLK